MEAEVRVAAVERKEARSGNVRWVLRDDAGKEYTTFRPQIVEPIPPDELYEKLEPFKQRVTDDIRGDGDEE